MTLGMTTLRFFDVKNPFLKLDSVNFESDMMIYNRQIRKNQMINGEIVFDQHEISAR